MSDELGVTRGIDYTVAPPTARALPNVALCTTTTYYEYMMGGVAALRAV